MTVRGACPGLFRPMPTGDGLLVRLRPPAGRLSSAAAEAIATLAATHGNGAIDLGRRGGTTWGCQIAAERDACVKAHRCRRGSTLVLVAAKPAPPPRDQAQLPGRSRLLTFTSLRYLAGEQLMLRENTREK